MALYDIMICWSSTSTRNGAAFFHAIEEILVVQCSVARPRKNSQTCLQNPEVTLETFWKISTSPCHGVPNERATCSTQTVNQNTNVSAEVCKVPIRGTSG